METYIKLTALVGVLIAWPCSAEQSAFDAASVKLADPAARPSAAWRTTRDAGRIHYGHVLMNQLLQDAYGVQIDQIMGGPGWVRDFMGPNFYEVDATMTPETTKEQFQNMMQNLLAERFHLVVHHETRSFPGYDLVLAKGGPKMKVAAQSPKDATAAADTPGLPTMSKDGFPNLPPGPGTTSTTGTGTYREKNQERSMAEFAARLGHPLSLALGADTIADPATPLPRVVNKTGLAGRYDFILEFSCAGCRGIGALASTLPNLAGRTQVDTPPSAGASDPTGSGLPSIFAALEKQLGLRLEKVKGGVPVDVIVIEHLDKIPTEN
jgi:uncharacterized protein (TIGR03435 family)